MEQNSKEAQSRADSMREEWAHSVYSKEFLAELVERKQSFTQVLIHAAGKSTDPVVRAAFAALKNSEELEARLRSRGVRHDG